MSLKRNILANYVSQAYVALIGILIVPLYLAYMGAEAFGLVGFFTVLATWFQLLDVGLTPVMSRQASRFAGGAVDVLSLRRLLRALEGIFIGVAVVAVAAITASSGYLADVYFTIDQLPVPELKRALMVMIVVVALRWIGGLYRGVLTGLERIVWLGGFSIVMATARFVLVVPVLVFISATPTAFFLYQLIVAVIELAMLVWKTYHMLPQAAQSVHWEWRPVREVLHFSLSLALTATLWAVVANTDKLLLASLLPLHDYAYFTLGVLAASGISLIGLPINLALLPRMTKLVATGDDAGFYRLYQNATQLVGVTAIPVCLVLALFAEQVIWVWTGNEDAARATAPVLTLYALGNGVLVLCTLAQYFQYAQGDVRLHLLGQVLFVAFLIPAVIWSALNFGMVGAGYVWLATNVLYFMFWVPKVHARFLGGLQRAWLTQIAKLAVPTVSGAAVARLILQSPSDRGWAGVEILAVGIVLLCIAACSSNWVRDLIGNRLRAST
jgi:O-antigen/teichoic acid export membrane protein